MNNVFLIGKIFSKPIEIDKNNHKIEFILKVDSGRQNENDEYISDLISINATHKMSELIMKHLMVDDTIGVEGKINTQKSNHVVIDAQKLTFLKSGDELYDE